MPTIIAMVRCQRQRRLLMLSLFLMFFSLGCLSQGPGTADEMREVTVVLSNFEISPKTITANKGDVVKITVRNVEGEHNLFLDRYNLRTMTAVSQNTQVIMFVADKNGTFDMWCEVRGHRQYGMMGLLIVN